jgi:MFS family permease
MRRAEMRRRLSGVGAIVSGMNLAPYRAVLAIPGVARLTLVALLARIPVTAVGVVLTLHVVLALHRGYGPAGLVNAAATLGTAVGAPFLGRMVDRRGLRRMLLLVTVSEGLFWGTAPWLPYPALLVAAFAGGVLALPVFSVVRQSLAALVPPAHRRTAYSVDSMSIEVSCMIGPVLGVLAATQASTGVAMLGLGALVAAAGVALFVLNPPVRDEAAQGAGRPPVASWLGPALLAALVTSAAATLVLAGMDVAIVAALQAAGQLSWTGLTFAVWGVVSLFGGFVYGAMHRGVPALALAAVMGLATVPIGVAGGSWWALCLALLPAGALCAPTLASVADEVSRLAPEAVRGLVMGLQGSALTTGLAIGAPLTGAVVDAASPAWGFAVAGAAGAVLAGAAAVVQRVAAARPRARSPATSSAIS